LLPGIHFKIKCFVQGPESKAQVSACRPSRCCK
jgi:hypothetical protein